MSRAAAMLFTALTLGIAWAVRGHFGHEWGAAWAGGIGTAALLVFARRPDWTRRLPVLAALGALGWGAGGIMSYGIVIGYCRGIDFANVCYGYAMLAVIGGLHGFLGGGLLGLGLESRDDHRPCWASLFTQMIAAGYLTWGLLIYQFEWFMTPPRSEMWAGCLGAAIALGWFLQRENYRRALRVAAWGTLGGGVGFAFGNFIQTLGAASGISYNWWNVMEFTLGFCGGLGVAWGVLSTTWPETAAPRHGANLFALVFLTFAIPATNIINALDLESYVRLAERLGIEDGPAFYRSQVNIVWALCLLLTAAAAWAWWRWRHRDELLVSRFAPAFLSACALLYTGMSYIDAGMFRQPIDWGESRTAYAPLHLAAFLIWLAWRRRPIALGPDRPEGPLRWAVIAALFVAFLLAITTVSINAHDGLGGYHERF